MKPLPRPVREVLDEPALGPSVLRVWARVQLRRRVPAPLARPWLAFAGAVAALGFVLATWPTARVVDAGSTRDTGAGVVEPVRSPLGLRGRHSFPSLTRRAVTAAPASTKPVAVGAVGNADLSATPPPAVEAPTDVVGALLESADEAWRAGRTSHALALLGEVAEHHVDDPRASEAMFFVGLVELDTLNQPRRAAETLRRALELSPPEDLVAPLWAAYERAVTCASDGGAALNGDWRE